MPFAGPPSTLGLAQGVDHIEPVLPIQNIDQISLFYEFNFDIMTM